METNRFIIAHLQGPGTISENQERYLVTTPPATLRKCRAELGIFGAIPKLSKGQAWRLVRCVKARESGVSDG